MRAEAPLVIETGPQPVATVIWLHGLGADAHDFEPIISELRLPARLPIRFVFPNAPLRPVTINGGYVMRAWYDIAPGDGCFLQNEAHIRESVNALSMLVTEEAARGIGRARIVLAGFSQGALIAAATALTAAPPFAGLLALSMPPLPAFIDAAADPCLPVFLAHGSDDDIVPFFIAERNRDQLVALGCQPDWRPYRMGHSVCAEEVRDISAWLQTLTT